LPQEKQKIKNHKYTQQCYTPNEITLV